MFTENRKSVIKFNNFILGNYFGIINSQNTAINTTIGGDKYALDNLALSYIPSL